MKSSEYLRHLQNTSPCKTTFSFSKTNRFIIPKSQSPSKFYEKPPTRSSRATSLGKGSKVGFMNKTGDPGTYNIRRTFEVRDNDRKKNSTTFGESHTQVFNKELRRKSLTPGPGKYEVSETLQPKSNFTIGKRLVNFERLSTALDLGPQSYSIKMQSLERTSRFNNSRVFRIKTESSGLPRYNIEKFDNKIPAANQYNPENLITIESLMKSKKIKGACTFTREQRLKKPKKSILGPGSYSAFSVFG